LFAGPLKVGDERNGLVQCGRTAYRNRQLSAGREIDDLLEVLRARTGEDELPVP